MLGIECQWAVPKGCEPDDDVVERAKLIAKKTDCRMSETNDPVEAVNDANFIYTDVFISMGWKLACESDLRCKY